MRQAVRVSVSVVVLVAALLGLQLRPMGEAVPLRKPLDGFPAALGDWRAQGGTVFGSEILNTLKLTDYVMRDYVDSTGRNVNLYIGYWARQGRKGGMVHSPKNCLPGAGWEPVEASVVTIPLPPPHRPIVVNRYLIQKERAQQVVFYWYHSQGRAIAGEVPARIAMVKSMIFLGRSDGALVRIMSPIYGSAGETSDRLVAYAQAIYPLLGEFLPG